MFRVGDVRAIRNAMVAGSALVLAGATACGRQATDTTTSTTTAVGSPCEARFIYHEFGSDYAMTATLSHPPAVGDKATLTVGVCATKPIWAAVSVRLRDGVEWQKPPEGTAVTAEPAPYGGCQETAAGQWDLPAMTPVYLTGTVVATETGTAELAGYVGPATADGTLPGNSASVFITVGADSTSSHFGYPPPPEVGSAESATPQPIPVCD